MHAYSTAEWQGLFIAEAGASAALAGLLFVAISINLARILQGAGLPGRAGEAIVLLVAVLVISTLALVPGQSPTVLGAELLAAGLVAWSVRVAAVSLLLRAGGRLYWLVPGVVLCLVVAVLDAWVLLIEILR
jgi:modulator of FtsH protease